MDNHNADPFVELEAMKKIAETLTAIDPDARSRVLQWASDRFSNRAIEPKTNPQKSDPIPAGTTLTATEPVGKFATVAEFYAAANPKNESEKVAIIAYWFQTFESLPDFDSQRVNTELKHLGHGVGNVTAAFSSLMNRKPQYVIQTRKSGTSKQARKRYVLTNEGKKFVEGLLTSDT